MAAMAIACALLAPTAGLTKEKPDSYDPDIVQGDWIHPADVLFVGDSESLGYFGAQLYRALTTEPDPRSGKPLTVWSFWTCGSDVATWKKGGVSYCGIRTCTATGDCARDHGPLDRPGHVHYMALRQYIARIHPRITIVSLGSNMLTTRPGTFRAYYDTYLETVGDLVGDIVSRNSQCVWIGPPQAAIKTKPVADYERFVADVGKTAKAGGCAFIDSNPLSDRSYVLKGDPEGIHYQGVGEKAWEAKVWGALKPVLAARLSR